MRLVRQIKQYSHHQVANAMGAATDWYWKKPNSRPHNVEKMLKGLPRPDLERILAYLEKGGEV